MRAEAEQDADDDDLPHGQAPDARPARARSRRCATGDDPPAQRRLPRLSISPDFHHSHRGGFREEERCRDRGCRADDHRDAPARRAQATDPPAPAPAQPRGRRPRRRRPFVTAGPRVDLSIEEAVARARDKNIDIGVARITPRLTDFTIAGLEANYRLNLTTSANASTSHSRPPTRRRASPRHQPEHRHASLERRPRAEPVRAAATTRVSWTNNRRDSRARQRVPQPDVQLRLHGQLTQPLMRGFRIDATRAALKTNRISQQNDEIALQSTEATTMANTRNAYWDLVFAIQAVEAAQNSLDISSKLVQDNQARVEIGTLAPIDIKSARSRAGQSPADPGAGAGDRPHRGARAEAPDRQRHRRPAVGARRSTRSTARRRRRSRSTWRRRSRARSASAPTCSSR